MEGIDTINGRGNRCSEIVQQLPDFKQFCNPQKEVIDGSYWTTKTQKQTLDLTPGGYEGTWHELCNQKRSDEATERALRWIQ